MRTAQKYIQNVNKYNEIKKKKKQQTPLNDTIQNKQNYNLHACKIVRQKSKSSNTQDER